MHKIKIILGTGDKYKINFEFDNGRSQDPSDRVRRARLTLST